MALVKQNLDISFSQGLDTKTDPFRVSPGKFLSLENTIFTKAGSLVKRNGYGSLPDLPDTSYRFASTFNGNLTAVGSRIAAFINGSSSWVDRGSTQPVSLNTLPLVRSNLNQSQSDTVVAPNNLVCTVFTDNVPSGGSTVPSYKYSVSDSITGQTVIAPTVIPATTGVINGAPRVFLLGRYFVIVCPNNLAGTYRIQYFAINFSNISSITAPVILTSSYTNSGINAFDGVVSNNTLYLGFNGVDGGGAVRVTSLSSGLIQGITTVFAGRVATHMSLCADETNNTPIIYLSFYDAVSSTGFTAAVSQALAVVLAPVATIAALQVPAITCSAQNGICTVLYEVLNAYSFDSSIRTDFLNKVTVTQAGSVSATSTLIRSVGLGSKSFIIDGIIYVLTAYDGRTTGTTSGYQPTYFLIDSSGNLICKLAYSNGGGYLPLGLPSVTVDGSVAKVSYLIKDSISAVNKNEGDSPNQSSAVYSQTGINLAFFNISTEGMVSAEIGGNLNLSGGFLWGYDGSVAVENNFNIWPDLALNADGTYHGLTTAGAGGNLSAQKYFYQVVYEWSDNQGNTFRSAPSIPVGITTVGATSTNTLIIPTLRLTYKTTNPIRIVVYRASAAQQTYYQASSSSVPILNSTTADTVTFVDTLSDAGILGNNIIYTNGGVVENIGPPSTSAIALYKSRLFMVDAEDKNLIWFSKQVIEATPVEMSDLFTIYIAPTTAAQGDTGPITALSVMDDKLVIFKKNAIYYITGVGPDNTGANNDFSDPVFISSTVGCESQNSIVFAPDGLMFQSDGEIWMLGRNLQTSYIGAPVEQFTSSLVRSALNVPATNQVRFILESGITLMYDYYYGQWGTFTNVPAISSTIYQGLHTYINSYGKVFQETPDKYMDGSNPVLISFVTSWFNLAGLQGYQRAYFFYLLGTYYSPHKLSIDIAYDYSPGVSQNVLITPNNFNPNYGADSPYGAGSPYGGNPILEQWRVFLTRQRCQSFQIRLREVFDASLGVPAGQGLSLSGMNLVVALKKAWSPVGSSVSTGGQQ